MHDSDRHVARLFVTHGLGGFVAQIFVIHGSVGRGAGLGRDACAHAHGRVHGSVAF